MRSRQGVGIIVAMGVIAIGALVARAEEHTIQMTAPWEGRARIFVTGEHQAFALGVFAGRLTVEKPPQALHDARLVCPGGFDLDYATKVQRGEGGCIITTGTGERLFARWSCVGEPDKGCAGRFVLTGGTGAYQGVTGDGDLTLLMTLAELTHLDQLDSGYDLRGVATW